MGIHTGKQPSAMHRHRENALCKVREARTTPTTAGIGLATLYVAVCQPEPEVQQQRHSPVGSRSPARHHLHRRRPCCRPCCRRTLHRKVVLDNGDAHVNNITLCTDTLQHGRTHRNDRLEPTHAMGGREGAFGARLETVAHASSMSTMFVCAPDGVLPVTSQVNGRVHDRVPPDGPAHFTEPCSRGRSRRGTRDGIYYRVNTRPRRNHGPGSVISLQHRRLDAPSLHRHRRANK